MKDLTTGSVPRHLLEMALPIAIGLFVQTLYYLVDLYFVGRLGGAALAGVSAAGNLMFFIMALTQIIGVGAVALMSQAVGRKQQSEATTVFNQSMMLSTVLGVCTLVGGYALAPVYMGSISADQPTLEAGVTYLYWFVPCMALQFAIVTMGSALRATGIVKPTMIVQLLTVILNIILAPVFIAGWGSGYPMGVAGAGLASTVSVAVGVLMLWWYFARHEKYVAFNASQWRPDLTVCRKIFGIGVPVGGEFALLFVYFAVIYWAIQGFGASAQAGFGLGSRILQAIFLPAMAIAFSIPAVAGQNVGAGLNDRVRATYKWGLILTTAMMVLVTILCQIRPGVFITPFSTEPEVIKVGTDFLRIISINFVFSGIIFVCSGMFQGLGNTWPATISTGTRLITFAIPLVYLSTRDDFAIEQIWYLSVATVALQSITSYFLLKREFRLRLSDVSSQVTASAS